MVEENANLDIQSSPVESTEDAGGKSIFAEEPNSLPSQPQPTERSPSSSSPVVPERVLPFPRETVAEDAPVKPTIHPHTHAPAHHTPVASEQHSFSSEFSKFLRAFPTSNPLWRDIFYLIHWVDPFRTGMIFGIINLFFFLVIYGRYSVLNIISYCLFILLSVAIVYSQGSVYWAKLVQGRTVENPLLQKWRVTTVSRVVLEKHVESINQLVNVLIEISMDIFLCGDVFFSIKWAAIFYVVAAIGSWFEGFTLLWVLTWVVFVWPRFYLEKKADVDRIVTLVHTQINTYTALVQSKIPIFQQPQPQPTQPSSDRRKVQ